MKVLLNFAATVRCSVGSCHSYQKTLGLRVCSVFPAKYSTSSVFPGRTTPPGLKGTYKVWWAKEITPDLHIAGRLTERQIKYAAEAGFKSIVSLFTYPDDRSGNFGGCYLPTTKEEKHIVEDIAGMQFVNLLGHGEDWATVAAVEKLSATLPSLKGPVLLHCNRGYTITFVTLMYLANQTRLDSSFKPQIKSKQFFDIAAAMGVDFNKDSTKEVVAKITGEPQVKDPVCPETEPKEWFDYWVAHPVYKNWYSSGQILKSHTQMMEKAGFKAVVNVRPGLQFQGTPSQEEVNLLNIQERTGTYATSKHEPRQSLARLEETRINPKLPSTYIDPYAPVNFETKDEQEFGDEVGYNSNLEGKFLRNSSLKYFHMPLMTSRMTYVEFFKQYMDELLEAGKLGPVNVHCARGMRAGYIATLGAAVQHKKDLTWALKRSSELGFPISKDTTPDVYKAFEDWLTGKEKVSRTKRGKVEL